MSCRGRRPVRYRRGEGEETACHFRMLDNYSAIEHIEDFLFYVLTVYICPWPKGRVLRQHSSDIMVCAIGIMVGLFGVIMVLWMSDYSSSSRVNCKIPW